LAIYQNPHPVPLQIEGWMSCGPPIYVPCDFWDAIGIEKDKAYVPSPNSSKDERYKP